MDVSNENRKWKWTREERKKDKEHLYSNNLFGFLDYFFGSYNVTLNTKNLFIFYFSDKFQFELLNIFLDSTFKINYKETLKKKDEFSY